jgi:hypothetical protein
MKLPRKPPARQIARRPTRGQFRWKATAAPRSRRRPSRNVSMVDSLQCVCGPPQRDQGWVSVVCFRSSLCSGLAAF